MQHSQFIQLVTDAILILDEANAHFKSRVELAKHFIENGKAGLTVKDTFEVTKTDVAELTHKIEFLKKLKESHNLIEDSQVSEDSLQYIAGMLMQLSNNIETDLIGLNAYKEMSGQDNYDKTETEKLSDLKSKINNIRNQYSELKWESINPTTRTRIEQLSKIVMMVYAPLKKLLSLARNNQDNEVTSHKALSFLGTLLKEKPNYSENLDEFREQVVGKEGSEKRAAYCARFSASKEEFQATIDNMHNIMNDSNLSGTDKLQDVLALNCYTPKP